MADSILNECFAKTINYSGIHSKFCLDHPEIIETELKIQERKDDIKKFTELMLSTNSEFEDNERIKELSKYDSLLSELADDENLLRDLGLL